MKRYPRRVVLVGAGASMLAATATGRAQGTPESTVVGWINRNAATLASTDPDDPLDDLRPLRRVVGHATVVGLGEPTHGSREQFRTKHRMVRFLVEHMGFRTLAFEEDFASGVVLDRYVLTGDGDPRQLVADMSTPFWATEEIVDLLQWLRSHNETHRDKVRFLGTDIVALRDSSFDEVAGHVRRVAPDRLDELARDLTPIRPTRNRYAHMAWYFSLPDNEKQQLIDNARRVRQLVGGLPATGPRLEREYAEQHARAIVGWYVNYATDFSAFRTERELAVVDTIGWWQGVIGGKIAYWAANAHTAAAPVTTYQYPGAVLTGTFAGGYLRQRLGRRYVSIGTMFHEGAITSDYAAPSPHPIGPPPPSLLDYTLGQAARPDYLLDLHAPAHGPARAWLRGPAATRMILPSYVEDDDGSRYTMSVDSLSGAFDAITHIRTTTPSRLTPGPVQNRVTPS